jgi:hypothetical protein
VGAVGGGLAGGGLAGGACGGCVVRRFTSGTSVSASSIWK